MIFFCFFFFNDTATTEIYTLSLHDALPILRQALEGERVTVQVLTGRGPATPSPPALRVVHAWDARMLRTLVKLAPRGGIVDRKSTRLNSSHANISYAVFCLKKKKKYGTTIS